MITFDKNHQKCRKQTNHKNSFRNFTNLGYLVLCKEGIHLVFFFQSLYQTCWKESKSYKFASLLLFVQSTIHFGKNINIFWHNSFTESWSSFWLSFLEISKILTKISFFKFQTENFFSGKRYGNFSKKKIVSSRSLKWETNKKPTNNKPRTVPII